MKKPFLERLKKKEPENEMNPENYNRRLEQVEDGDAAAQKEGCAWFQKMAERGYANAKFVLAMCLRDGIGTEADTAQAVQWLKASAEEGYHEAQFLMGVYCIQGNLKEIETDEEAGKLWLELAVEQHDHEAEYIYGM